MRLYLIRHGETAHNRNRIMQGHEEVPLNDTGIEQAARLGRRMAELPLDHIYASDLRRAAMTAAIMAGITGRPLTYHEGFRERHPGELSGISYDEAQAFFTDPDYHPPGGESVPDFAGRVQQAFDWLVQQEGGRGRSVAVVTHGMVCAAYLSQCVGLDMEHILGKTWPNTCITIADFNGSGWQLVSQGDASHLDGMPEFIDHVTGG